MAAPTKQTLTAAVEDAEAEASAEQTAAVKRYEEQHPSVIASVRKLWTEAEDALVRMGLLLADHFADYSAAGMGKQKDYCEAIGKAIGRSSSSVWKYLKAGEEAKVLGLTAEAIAEAGVTVGMLSELRQLPAARAKQILRRKDLTEAKVTEAVRKAKSAGSSPEDAAEAEATATEALGRKLRDSFYEFLNSITEDASAEWTTAVVGTVQFLGEQGLLKVPTERARKAVLSLTNEYQHDSSANPSPEPGDTEAEAEAN
jgi:hypothetical protein